MDPGTLQLDLLKNVNEFQIQDIRLPLEVEGKDVYKIFEVKCSIRQESSLPAGFKGPLYETEFEKISPYLSASPHDF